MVEQQWPALLAALIAGQDLDADACRWAMGEVLAGDATPAQVAAFAVALRAKGETAGEIGGLVEAMLAAGTPLTLPTDLAARRLVDTCGTGGDRRNTVNISTMAALVVAGAGETVVKHGNRAASSASGSADVLEALGIPVALEPAAVARCVAEAGIGFCFAPVFHPAMRHAGPTRREIGVPTFFNVLGPLANPARPAAQLVGVADARLAPLVADVLAARGVSALVVRGEEGLDELTLAGRSQVWEVREGAVAPTTITPADAGCRPAPVEALAGGDAAANADVARAVLAGDERGPVRDAVVLNAAGALVAAATEADGPLAGRMAAAAARAAAAIDGGAASAVLDRWRAVATEAAAPA
jgi:anthranilate phosphoribosyltransferase